ncbi:MAG: YitT family protein [Bacteroidales bacterium]|nr:YitT family protein [Bacteroidales bacterium]
MSNRKILKTVWGYVVITLACMLYCSAWTQVFMPNGIASGGITGLCTIIQYGTGFPMYISYGIINALLLVLAFLILGRTFGIRTIYAMAAITLFMDILPMLDLPVLVLKEGNGLLVPVIASLMEAFSIAIMINYGSSSGGTDIIALILNKYLPVSLGQVYVATDLVIIASIMLIPGKTIDDMLYGYLAVIVFSLGLDYLMLGRKSSVQMIVFSDHYAEIADYINKKLDRGVTALNAIGWYSQKDKKVLLILVRRSEMPQITDKIKKVDPRAFVAVTPVSSVYGEGFEEIKTSLKLKRKNDEQDN